MRGRAALTALLAIVLTAAAGAALPATTTAAPAPAPAPAAAGAGARDGRVLVSFAPGVTAAASRAAAFRAGGSVVERLKTRALPVGRRLYTVRSATSGTMELVRRLAADPRVDRVEPDYVLSVAATTPDDPLYASQWGMAVIGAPAAWDITTGSSSVVVADIDTGVRYDHPDLAANMWHNPAEWGGVAGEDDDLNGYVDDLYGIDAADADSDPADGDATNSHGTHVAGIIAAAGNNGVGVAGVGWSTRIMALRCLDAAGSGSVSKSIKCIDYAVWQKQHGVNVVAINASWGGDDQSAFLRLAIDEAGDAGIVFVAAAGNDGRDTDVTPYYPSSYDSRSIVAVANSTATDDRRATSNWGLTSVDLAAPGTGILSTVGTSTDPSGYKALTGTSMAAPQVSGVVALCAAAFPTEGVEARIDRVVRGVDRLPAWSGICVSGGRLNALRALDTTPPVTTASGVPTGWSKVPVTVTLTARDDLSGVQATEYSLDAAPFQPGGAVVVSAPGAHTLRYRSVDKAGNSESPRTALVKVDPVGPITSALARVVVRRGGKATFPFKVSDLTPRARVTIRIYLGTRLKKTLSVGGRPTGVRQTYSWPRCLLARGTYTWRVYAVDQAGNAQSRIGSARLVVR